MGCGCSAAAAQEPRAQAQSPVSLGVKLVPGQPAIIRNCPNNVTHLNGQRVICEEYNVGLGEWFVKGDRFPLTVGMSLGAQFLEGIVEPAPTLLSRDSSNVKMAPGQNQDLLGSKLEQQSRAALDCSKEDIGDIVSDVHKHANGIIQKGSGLGASGDCPFASAHEVNLYFQFCLKVLTKWSDHGFGQDEDLDNDFYSQINDLCEILGFLDIDAVTLPEDIEKNIQLIQREGLFPNWVRGQVPKGEAGVRLCLVIGRKWQLEDTDAFQEALASLEGHN